MAPVAALAAESDVRKLRYFDGVSAVLVTLVLSVTVIEHWHAYRLFDKCLSLPTLLIIGAFPWGAIRMQKRGQQVEVWQVYLLLLLVTFLFR
jgi:hypothetical protein